MEASQGYARKSRPIDLIDGFETISKESAMEDSNKKLIILGLLTGLLFIGFTLFVCFVMIPEEARIGKAGMIRPPGTESVINQNK